ncbi:MAG: hypothetical protein DA408_19755 [Bacteroidetes bacterium]|nr:MAG: hypothetical protein DA408_19755 [Bacteroidota bacterium]
MFTLNTLLFNPYIKMERKYEFRQDADRHECVTWVEDGFIVFACNSCGFLRKMNIDSGDLSTVHLGDPEVLHRGSHQPVGLVQQVEQAASN